MTCCHGWRMIGEKNMNGDLISRQAASNHLKPRLYETALNNDTEHPYYEEIADNRVDIWLNELPSVYPDTPTVDIPTVVPTCEDML